jgi:hypothetical protein
MTGKLHSHRPHKAGKQVWHEKPVSAVPIEVRMALQDAMRIENVPNTDYDDLLWIMAQESEGVVDAHNGKSTARGLYQLLAGSI